MGRGTREGPAHQRPAQPPGLSLTGVSTYAEDSSRLGNIARPRRDIPRDNSVRTYVRTVTDSDPAKNDATSPKRDSRADLRGLEHAPGRIGSVVSSESDAMTEEAVVADDASPVDDHAVLMVKPDSSP